MNMIGNQIKKLRTEQGMTQKQLADKLFVSAQAVSRWENNEVEPSVATITEIAKIFDVSTDVVLGVLESDPEPQPASEPEVIVEKEYVIKEAKPVLAVCEQCNRPIYNGAEIVRKTSYHRVGGNTTHILCRECDNKNKKRAHDTAVSRGVSLRKRSFVWGILGALAVLGIMIGVIVSNPNSSLVPLAVILPIAAFTMISCCILQNNFIGEMTVTVGSWGIHLPGLIFSLDLEGIIWFLTVKLALFILGILGTIAMWALAIALGATLSLLVYPFAIYKNFKNPEKNED